MDDIKPNQSGMWYRKEINSELSIAWKKNSSDIVADICNFTRLVKVFNLYIPLSVSQPWNWTES